MLEHWLQVQEGFQLGCDITCKIKSRGLRLLSWSTGLKRVPAWLQSNVQDEIHSSEISISVHWFRRVSRLVARNRRWSPRVWDFYLGPLVKEGFQINCNKTYRMKFTSLTSLSWSTGLGRFPTWLLEIIQAEIHRSKASILESWFRKELDCQKPYGMKSTGLRFLAWSIGYAGLPLGGEKIWTNSQHELVLECLSGNRRKRFSDFFLAVKTRQRKRSSAKPFGYHSWRPPRNPGEPMRANAQIWFGINFDVYVFMLGAILKSNFVDDLKVWVVI